MTNTLTESLTAIDEAAAGSPGSEYGRIPGTPDRSLRDRYTVLRFKPGGGRPIIPVRVPAR